MDTDVLPTGFVPLPFDSRGGLPQTVPFQVANRTLQITLVPVITDLPALLSAGEADLVLDAGAVARTRAADPAGSLDELRPADLFLVAPSGSLDGAEVFVVVREGDALLASAPARVGAAIPAGSTDRSGLVAEVAVGSLRVRVGSFVRPGDVGSEVLIGARGRLAGAPRYERSEQAEGRGPHDLP